jgi:hypothetical protein
MSQDSSINQPLLKASGEPPRSSWEDTAVPIGESSTFSVDSYADDLMDELFDEVDHILDKGVRVPPDTHSEDYGSLQPIAVPEMGLSSVLVPHRQIEADQLEELEADLELLPSGSHADRRYGFGKSLDRLLLISACASLVLTAVLGVLLQGKWQRPEPVAQDPVTADQLQAQADAEFLDYMERSLQVIERKATANNSSATAEIPAPPAPASSSSGNQTAPEASRVFVPVYQPPPSLFPGLGQSAQPAQPVQPGQANPSVPPVQPAVPSAPASAPVAAATAPNIAPSLNYTLRGLLELGDRSAALFEINGTPQRIYVGESIGSSGWTLVSVQNEEAIIRRNGEVRSVYVGQQF